MSGDASYNQLMETIRHIKVLHSNYSLQYRTTKSAAIELARKIWGHVVSYRYEDVPINENSYTKLMLASIIAERLLLKHHKNLYKHVTISIIGLGGAGKTTYSVLSAYGALRMLGVPRSKALSMEGALTFFSAKEFVDFAYQLINQRKWVPFIIIDDVGSQISKYWIFLGQYFWAYLFSILDQLKDWCGVLIMTARSFNSIPARMRELTDLVVEAKEVDMDGIILDLFFYYMYDDYVSMKRKQDGLKYIDVMLPVVKMPDHLWERMVEIRRATGLERMTIIKEAVEIQPKLELLRLQKIRERVEKLESAQANNSGEELH